MSEINQILSSIESLEKKWDEKLYNSLQSKLSEKMKECTDNLQNMEELDNNLKDIELSKDSFDEFIKEYESASSDKRFDIYKNFVTK